MAAASKRKTFVEDASTGGSASAISGPKSQSTPNKLKEQNGHNNGGVGGGAGSSKGANGSQLQFTESLLASAKENEMVQKYLVAETKKFSLKS